VEILTEVGAVTSTVAEAFVFPVLVLLTVMGSGGLDVLTGELPPSTLVVVELEVPVAVMVTGRLTVTLGAVKTPSLEMAPALVVQVTAVFGLPLMRATNCNLPNDATVAVFGESVSVV
jgi:hypothetical protein